MFESQPSLEPLPPSASISLGVQDPNPHDRPFSFTVDLSLIIGLKPLCRSHPSSVGRRPEREGGRRDGGTEVRRWRGPEGRRSDVTSGRDLVRFGSRGRRRRRGVTELPRWAALDPHEGHEGPPVNTLWDWTRSLRVPEQRCTNNQTNPKRGRMFPDSPMFQDCFSSNVKGMCFLERQIFPFCPFCFTCP